MCGEIAEKEGILVGGSGGLNVFAAVELAKKMGDTKANIVCILPDSGTKYLSKIYNDAWLKENNLF